MIKVYPRASNRIMVELEEGTILDIADSGQLGGATVIVYKNIRDAESRRGNLIEEFKVGGKE